MNIIIQIFFLITNIASGKYQAYRFDILQRRINHTLWAAIYFLIAAQSFWITKNLWLIGALILQHLPVFNTSLNFFRKVQLPFWQQLFYTDVADPNGSWEDKLWGKLYPVVFFLSLISLIIIQFFL